MRVDAFDPVTPSRAFVFQNETQSLGAIIDGSGSWGSGREAADRTRELLGNRWQSAEDWSADSLIDDISTVASSTPNDLRDREFGWSFSVTCLLCTHDLIVCAAAGFYRVDVRGRSGTTTLFRPEMLVDQFLANGTLTAETAAAFPHRNICLGPFVGDRDLVALSTARHVVAPDDVVVVTHAARFNLPGIRVPPSAEALAALAIPDAYPSPVIVVTP
jgi:hypothetical protein